MGESTERLNHLTAHAQYPQYNTERMLTWGLVDSLAGQTVTVGGWVKTAREQGNKTFAFIELNDGSTFTNVQVLLLLHSPAPWSAGSKQCANDQPISRTQQ